ncbi:hypothetical protein DIPPA_19261 [Diplonema papillatum]|nr:hypothetical protein DIPPA_19261 [Diplonema papillatum]
MESSMEQKDAALLVADLFSIPGARDRLSFVQKKLVGPRPPCAKCGAKTKVKRCCENVHYCSVTCQDEHWPRHKFDCKRVGGGGGQQKAAPAPPMPPLPPPGAPLGTPAGRSGKNPGEATEFERRMRWLDDGPTPIKSGKGRGGRDSRDTKDRSSGKGRDGRDRGDARDRGGANDSNRDTPRDRNGDGRNRDGRGARDKSGAADFKAGSEGKRDNRDSLAGNNRDRAGAGGNRDTQNRDTQKGGAKGGRRDGPERRDTARDGRGDDGPGSAREKSEEVRRQPSGGASSPARSSGSRHSRDRNTEENLKLADERSLPTKRFGRATGDDLPSEERSMPRSDSDEVCHFLCE